MLWRLATAAAGISVGAAAATVWWKHSPSPTPPPRCDSVRHEPSGSSPSDMLVRKAESYPVTCFTKRSISWAIQESRKLIRRIMVEQGIPGAVVSVSVDGCEVWSEGIGYADLENDVACTPHTVMRIASISKCLTAVAAMQLWEDGLLDLDASVQSYVPEFPSKTYDGKEVTITSRQLLCHMAGIRHYKKASELNTKRAEFQNDEYFIKDHYDSVLDSLELFSKDDLVHAPGTKFHYTTHGWTLLSAVIERASGQPFLDYLHSHILSPLGMDSTGPEKHTPLTYHRARYYVRNSSGRLQNSPYVDNSYKWAGGGLASSAPDLCRLGAALLLCSQSQSNNTAPSLRELVEQQKNSKLKGDSSSLTECNTNESPFLLKPETVSEMWREVVSSISFSRNPRLGYGLGWVVQSEGERVKGGKKEPLCVGHTGTAVGASSVLVILPNNVPQTGEGSLKNEVCKGCLEYKRGEGVKLGNTTKELDEEEDIRGVVVAIICNLQQVQGLFSLGSQIAIHFNECSETSINFEPVMLLQGSHTIC